MATWKLEGSRSVTLTDDYHFELRDITYYYMGMSVDAGFGVLGDDVKPKEPKRASLKWFETGEAHANNHELLLWALLLAHDAETAGGLDKWARSVHSELTAAIELKEQWKPLESWGTFNSVSKLFLPIVNAASRSWTEPELKSIATAMRAATWHPGQHDDLDVDRLRHYLKSKPLGVRKGKREGPQRWRTWSIVYAADTVRRHGATLRQLLNLDVEVQDVPTASDIIAKRDATIVDLESQLGETSAALALKTDAHRKAASRNTTLREARTEARRGEREKWQQKAKQKLAAFREKEKERQTKAAQLVEEGLEAAYADDYASALAKVAKARARARKVEKEAKASRANLKRAKDEKDKVDSMQGTLDEMKSELEATLRATKEPRTSEASRRDEETGRFKAEPWQHRVIKWAQLACRVPPSCIAANIRDVLAAFAPDVQWAGVTKAHLRRLRSEVTVGGEAIAALRMAMAKRFVSFGFDETTKFGKHLLSTNAQLETHDESTIDVVPRGATLTAGGTAQEISKSIDEKIFTHGRRLLRLWKAAHELLNGKGSWAAAGMPDPEGLGLHRLSEQTLLMSDTCNAARACKRLLAEAAERAGRKQVGEDAWNAMSEPQRTAKCKSHLGDCHQHLRNIVLNAAAQGATSYLKNELGDSLDEFSAFDGMLVDGMDLIRAIFKELHVEGEYAKGKQREFDAWRKRYHASEAYMPFERANGSRQDLAFDGAVPIFANRTLVLQFLHGIVSVPTHDNKLEKFLWHVLSCNEVTALLRTSTLVKLLISEPWRWLCGKASKLTDWSIVKSNEVLDAVEQAFIAIAADGSKLFAPDFDPFAAVAASQPAFAEWRKQQQEHMVKAPDGTVHRIHELVLAEARNPKQMGNVQAADTTLVKL